MDDYSSCCRLCLSSQEENLSLFGAVCSREYIPQKILCILSILVHPQDTLPQEICPTCVDLVKQFYKFHRTASRSLEHLLTLLEKDDDVDKVLYSKCQKNFRNKNFSLLSGNSKYEALLQEKYNEVKASVDDVTSRFSSVQDPLAHSELQSSQMNRLPSVSVPSPIKSTALRTSSAVSRDNIVINVSKGTVSTKNKNLNDDNQLIQIKLPKSKAKTDSPKKKDRTSEDIEQAPTTSVSTVKKTTGKRSIKPTVISSKGKKVKTKITLFRCKYCSCVYSTQKDLFDHDESAHYAFVDVKTYYGPSNLTLEKDFVNQVKKLTWPIGIKRNYMSNKRKSAQIASTPSTSRSSLTDDGSSGKKEEEQNKVNIRKRTLENQTEHTQHKPNKRMAMGPKSKRLKVQMANELENIDSMKPITKYNPKKRKIFVGPKSKNPNIKTQTEGNKYLENQCKYCKCELESKAPTAFLTHLKVKRCNIINSYSCSLCREDFSLRKDEFRKHEKTCNLTQFFTKESKCSQCPEPVHGPSLADHLLSVHKVLFKCFICSAEFNQKDCLLDHFLKCSFQFSIPKSYYPCPTCKCKFETLTSLKTHTLRSHTNNYLNVDVSLMYNELNEWVEKKSTSNILPYQRSNYINCNSKGDFVCCIKSCKKKLDTIFELEDHIQQHCKKGKKKGKVKSKAKGKKPAVKNLYSRLSICDTIIMKKYSIESEASSHIAEEFSMKKPKDTFLFNLGLVKHLREDTDTHAYEVAVFLRDFGYEDSIQSPRGIFELSENANVSSYHLKSYAKDQTSSPEIFTIDSDDTD